MKILHINSYFNGSIFYKNLFDKQVENGLEIDVYVPISNKLSGDKKDFGVYTRVSKNYKEYERYLFYLKHNKIFKNLNKTYLINKFDVVHSHSLFSNGFIAYKIKQQYKIPYIVAVRNTDVNLFFKKMFFLRNLGIKILKEAEGIIFLSESYKETVLEKYVPKEVKESLERKTFVIPNGINDFWFQYKVRSKKMDNNKRVKLLYVGAINKNKNIISTIKAVEILREKGIDVEYTVVGQVEDEEIYKAIKRSSYIKYISPKPKEELINIYRKNDIFVMPSITETFGLVYAEAMSQGLPLIYSKGQGFDKQFQEGVVGFSVDSTNEIQISEVILKILQNYNSISKNCIEKVTKFNWNHIEKVYLEKYKYVLCKKNR